MDAEWNRVEGEERLVCLVREWFDTGCCQGHPVAVESWARDDDKYCLAVLIALDPFLNSFYTMWLRCMSEEPELNQSGPRIVIEET